MADLTIQAVEFTANVFVHGKEWLQYRPQHVTVSGQFAYAALKLSGDRAREDQTARIVFIALVHPDRERGVGVAGVDADDGKANPLEFMPG
jgi:hypothetical protein